MAKHKLKLWAAAVNAQRTYSSQDTLVAMAFMAANKDEAVGVAHRIFDEEYDASKYQAPNIVVTEVTIHETQGVE